MHSTVTKKGQTTIPGAVRRALRIVPGDRLDYSIEGDHATLRVHPGLGPLKGVLKSGKGKGLSFDEIRGIAADDDVARLERTYGPRTPKNKKSARAKRSKTR